MNCRTVPGNSLWANAVACGGFKPIRIGHRQLIHVHQIECRTSENQSVVLTTMLGSCIAACLYDAEACVEGMNRAEKNAGAHRPLPEMGTHSDR
jgi:hypothetical protein